MIEPGWFHTNMKEATQWSPPHPAYQNPDMATAQIRARRDSRVYPGDVVKGAAAIYEIASLTDPPLHFPLGEDAIALLQAKFAEIERVVEDYRSWSEGFIRNSSRFQVERAAPPFRGCRQRMCQCHTAPRRIREFTLSSQIHM